MLLNVDRYPLPADAPAEAAAAAHALVPLTQAQLRREPVGGAAREAFGERGLVNLMVLMGYSNVRCAQQALAGARCVL
jgi:hypothetical protein